MEKQVVETRGQAADVLELMLRDMPLVRLYERWEQIQHSIPSYVKRLEDGFVPTDGYRYYRKRLVAGDIPATDDGFGSFDMAIRSLHERIIAHLDVGLLVEQPEIEYA